MGTQGAEMRQQRALGTLKVVALLHPWTARRAEIKVTKCAKTTNVPMSGQESPLPGQLERICFRPPMMNEASI